MTTYNASELANLVCGECSSDTLPFSAEEARKQLAALPGWELSSDGRRIRKHFKVRNFLKGLEFFQQLAPIAEAAGHHPDLHLENYREVTIEMWTHSIGGLSINDFVLAARIDQLSPSV